MMRGAAAGWLSNCFAVAGFSPLDARYALYVVSLGQPGTTTCGGLSSSCVCGSETHQA